MRPCLFVIVCALALSHFLKAEDERYHIGVLADTDKTEGGELAGLIADDLSRSKDVVIDYKSPDFTVSCFATHVKTGGAHGTLIVASVAIMSGHDTLLQHFALTADNLQSLAHKVASEFNNRELNHYRHAAAAQK